MKFKAILATGQSQTSGAALQECEFGPVAWPVSQPILPALMSCTACGPRNCAMTRWLKCLSILLILLGPAVAEAQQVPISRYARFTGNINFVATGGSLRTQSNDGNSCLVGNTSSQALSGIPAGSNILAAYLYWGGSGGTVDSTVTLNGTAVNAGRTFQATFSLSGTDFPYFGGFADVTSRVTGNGVFTFGGLTVATGNPHCGSSAVVAGWSLIVIYGSPAERLRAINVFDGLQWFRGSSVTLNPDGFRIPASNIDGRIAIVAWEGDPQNSTPLNGFSESLRFNGTLLDDGINVPNSDPVIQPYDGTINSLGVSNSWGVDVDTFDVSSLLLPGQTSATTVFSAGGDLVLLTAQVVSATSEPVVDLGITKTHVGNFVAGSNGSYTLRVSNAAGLQREDNVVTVTDTLPAGLSFVSGAGTGWTCAAAAQVVTCTHPPPLNSGASLPDLTLTVAVAGSAPALVTNTARVSSASVDNNPANDVATDPTVIVFPNLSTSTKTVTDLNGGEANPGDTLRYTITLTESAGLAATNVQVTDDAPANTTGFAVVSIPAGASNFSTGAGTGGNGVGFLDIRGISVPASGTATIAFDVQVPGTASPGTPIDNTATVQNPNGPGATPAAPQVIVSPSQIPASGAKPLYLRRTPALQLSRVPAGSGEGSETLGGGTTATWTLSPPLQLPFAVPAGNISIPLWLRRSGGNNQRIVRVTLSNSVTGVIGSAQQTISPPSSGTPSLFTFVVNNAATTVFPQGSVFVLTIENLSPNANRVLLVHPQGVGPNAYSQVVLDSTTVINVDSVLAYSAVYPGGTAGAPFSPGQTVYVRSVVSDPFGSFDISAVRLTLTDSASVIQVNGQAMTRVADSGAATATFEYAFTLPANAAVGPWTARVVADEGTEGTVSDDGVGSFVVQPLQPALRVQKTSEVLSDPLNGTTLPRRIPGSVQRYTITVTNTGPGPVDASSLVVTDGIPANTALFVGGASPVEFIDGAAPSGLLFNYATDVRFSNQPGGGAPYSYVPAPDAAGFDPAVTGLRIAPSGVLAPAAGASQPSFSLRFSVRVQ